MHLIKLSSSNEAIFYNYIKDNFADYFFFRVDYAHYPEKTKIFMAIEGDAVQAMLLIWSDIRIQIRGDVPGSDFLLKNVVELNTIDPISISGFEEHKIIIADRYLEYEIAKILYRMGLNSGMQKNYERYPTIRLSEDNRNDIASLMRISDPEFWGSKEPEDILIDEHNNWFGIEQDHKLVCVTSTWLYEKVGYLTIVGTHPDYWNKGYASSLISSVLKDIFIEHEFCYIMVRVDNPSAVHTYKKLGFRICNTHYNFEKKDQKTELD